MEPYIQISKINDFLYCPRSIYLHSLYESFGDQTFHQTPQVIGRLNHQSIEDGDYSSAKRYLMALPVFSDEYGIAGKIDIYDSVKKHLVERKTRIKNIYEGYLMQVYAQYFCMKEMGYEIEKIFLYSMEDNKKYEVEVPKEKETAKFKEILENIRNYDPFLDKNHSCQKCSNSIYGTFAW